MIASGGFVLDFLSTEGRHTPILDYEFYFVMGHLFKLFKENIIRAGDCFQVGEYDTPENLLVEDTAFCRMVQSTGPANSQYLSNLVFENKDKKLSGVQVGSVKRQLASSQWSSEAQYALEMTLSSSINNFQKLHSEDGNNILSKTKDAVIMLHEVLGGKHEDDINSALDRHHFSKHGWWFALYKIIEGERIFAHIQIFLFCSKDSWPTQLLGLLTFLCAIWNLFQGLLF